MLEKIIDQQLEPGEPDADLHNREDVGVEGGGIPGFEVVDDDNEKELDIPPYESDKIPNFEASNSVGARECEGKDSASLSEVIPIKTINEELEGKEHPSTGVPFKKDTIELPSGEVIEGVFPEFDSAYETELPPESYDKTDYTHEQICNENLAKAIDEDPELAKQFTPEQIEKIRNGDTPDGYTWHHHQQPGKMQLVSSDIHSSTGHKGGNSIWGNRKPDEIGAKEE